MASKRTYDVVATIGKYKDSFTGEEKKNFKNVGSAFTSPEGNISVKLEAVPVGGEWSGWLSLYPVKPKSGDEG
ncbi:MAG: hypothetical protein ACSHX0_06840 [Akkermansiaceae bacterium]